jgi:two-component system, cell cycle response regulator
MKILIVDDEQISRRILEAMLKKWGYETMSAENGAEAWELMQKPDAPNLVVSDWMMPHMDGIELCEKIRGIERPGYVYFILLTTKAEKKDVIQGLESGADDFIVKPFDHEELRSRVKIGERIIKLEQKIITLANTDYLTGVLNRRAFMQRLEEETNRGSRKQKGLSIILADIDHFKNVNDSYGHQAGDVILKEFTKKISEISRSYDIIGRYGGEEFVVCLPETDLEKAMQIAERMRINIEGIKLKLSDKSHPVITITASFGVASCTLECYENIDAIIKTSDDALYRAKAKGRNRVCSTED